MADKILMNKNALADLKSDLKEYNTALPVFEMKEQQLKESVQLVEKNIERLQSLIEQTNNDVQGWAAVMAEDQINIAELISVRQVNTVEREITGVTLEAFLNIDFEPIELDLLTTPLWADTAVESIVQQKTNRTLLSIEERNLAALQEELVEARRMKNALQEVFIPEARENIRKIEIYLGDVERLAIGCAKLVKKKKQDKRAAL